MKTQDTPSVLGVDSEAQERTASPFMARLTDLARTYDLGIAFGLLLLCSITRLMALPASLWEWDDILFARALHKYDLITHSPHPPGFPVFVVLTRLAYWVLQDEHLALAGVALIFTSMLAPALFYLYREIFQERRAAVAGALFGSFAPNVWLHSGAGRTDEVALVIGMIGLTLIIHGLRSRRALVAGCLLFGLGMGVRVTLLPLMAPSIALIFLIRLWHRQWRLVAVSLAAGTLSFLAWYVPFILKVTWPVYRFVMNVHSSFALEKDGIFAKNENGVLSYRFGRFFLAIWGGGWIMGTMYLLTAVALITLVIKRRWQILGLMAVVFLPFMAFTLYLNTPLSAPLYSLPYIPFFTGMAGYGLLNGWDLILRAEPPRLLKPAALGTAAAIAAGMAVWAYPVINRLHHEASPPIRAINYVKGRVDPQQDVVYYSGLFWPHVAFYLPQVKTDLLERVESPEADLIAPAAVSGRIFGLTTNPVMGGSDASFHWGVHPNYLRRLYRLTMGRYFNTYVTELTHSRRAIFLSGWYSEEFDLERSWRWMGRQGKVALFSNADSMVLRLRGSSIPATSEHLPTVILRLNGTEIDRFTANTSETERTVTAKVDSQSPWSILTIETDQALNPKQNGIGDDTRDLGFKCTSLEWQPAPGAKLINLDLNQFIGPGWHMLEITPSGHWRWSEPRAVMNLPAINADAELKITLSPPQYEDGVRANVTLEVAGTVIDKFVPPVETITKSYQVPVSVHHGQRSELVISTDKAITLGNNDGRRVGVQVYQIYWRPGQ
ncbi:MAG TPA: hypothetical protein VJ302_29700 [Blastocatellia bacterium]|nr:hypothetical protein [Blastocatellia bacterium]